MKWQSKQSRPLAPCMPPPPSLPTPRSHLHSVISMQIRPRDHTSSSILQGLYYALVSTWWKRPMTVFISLPLSCRLLYLFLTLCTHTHTHTHTHTPSFAWSTTNLFLNQTSKLDRGLTRSFYLYLNICGNRKPAPSGSMVPFQLPYLKEKSPFFSGCVCACVCVSQTPLRISGNSWTPIRIHIYTTLIFSFRNPKTHAKRRIHWLFTSYWAKMGLYLILILELKFCPLSLFRENLFFFFYSMMNWQILKNSYRISQWFFPQLLQPMITSRDFKTSFHLDQICPSHQCPPNNMKPKSEQNVPTALVVWVGSFVLFTVSLLMWPRPSEVFWQMYIHPKLPGLLPTNSSESITLPTYTFRIYF